MTGPSKRETPRRPATDIVHSGRDPFAHHGFVNTPVYRGSTVLFRTLDSFERRDQRYVYGRRGTPTSEALEAAIAQLEGGARTWLAPSGAAAIATALLSFTKTGDHILVADTVYQPTRKICDGPLKRFGVETTYYDPTIGAGIDYSSLGEVRDGEAAQSAYLEAVREGTAALRRAELRAALSAYCRLDTEALVRLVEFFGRRS